MTDNDKDRVISILGVRRDRRTDRQDFVIFIRVARPPEEKFFEGDANNGAISILLWTKGRLFVHNEIQLDGWQVKRLRVNNEVFWYLF